MASVVNIFLFFVCLALAIACVKIATVAGDNAERFFKLKKACEQAYLRTGKSHYVDRQRRMCGMMVSSILYCISFTGFMIVNICNMMHLLQVMLF